MGGELLRVSFPLPPHTPPPPTFAKTVADWLIPKAIHWIENNYSKVTFPILILQAGEDRLVHPQGATDLFNAAKSEDKEVKVYKGLFHELFNEPEKWDILAHVIKWLDARVPESNQNEEGGDAEQRERTRTRHAPMKAAL